MSLEICGRTATKHEAGKKFHGHDSRGMPRYTVEGLTHPKGEPIRYKSIQRAENDIRNRGLAR